ncbi:Kinesin- motor protein [Dimargaris xerosporica]|nr:Kinesin- motor protein [Dimargaris xerosporica]
MYDVFRTLETITLYQTHYFASHFGTNRDSSPATASLPTLTTPTRQRLREFAPGPGVPQMVAGHTSSHKVSSGQPAALTLAVSEHSTSANSSSTRAVSPLVVDLTSDQPVPPSSARLQPQLSFSENFDELDDIDLVAMDRAATTGMLSTIIEQLVRDHGNGSSRTGISLEALKAQCPLSSQDQVEHAIAELRVLRSPRKRARDRPVAVVMRSLEYGYSGRNEREQRENLPVVISTNGDQGREVHVKAHPNDKLMGKTYTFDRVYGPDSQQANIYRDVALPILEEVLLGYNCTIFAYGQTGTGKTYTMEGDLSCPQGRCTAEAGIIPRTLFQLFEMLDTSRTEYSVRVSYMELYNEELRDLLATGDDDHRKLRIFDDSAKDSTKKGVIIHGLEELPVNNAIDAIGVLQKGSIRRQVAATKCNDKSSRSHAIFSITVHIKEATPDGEDLLKVGKLYLVDLAGSENIGRSGAENRRAREAGMINQSLLTLGRVIDLLIKHAAYIPYRDSKLTRILQDSLGGHTKTSIIATIAPTKADFEETLNTLDYAYRARNIKNKPEINQRMTKKALIKEYIAEIERLKADLLAAREKNGVYLTSDSYQQLMDESRARRDLTSELKSELEKAQVAIQVANNKYQALEQLLNSTQGKLQQTEGLLLETNHQLVDTSKDLDMAKTALQEQVVITNAHADTETSLDQVAHSLLTAIQDAVNDVHLLQAKIDRHDAVDQANEDHLSAFQSAVLEYTDFLQSEVREYQSLQTDYIDQFVKKLRSSWTNEQTTLKAHLEALEGAVTQTLDQHATMGSQSHDYTQRVLESAANLQQWQNQLADAGITMTTALQAGLDSHLSALTTELDTHTARFTDSLAGLAQGVVQAVQQLHTTFNDQKCQLETLQTSALATVHRAAEQAERISADMDALVSKHAEESTNHQERIVAQVTALLTNAFDDQRQALAERVRALQSQQSAVQGGWEDHHTTAKATLTTIQNQIVESSSTATQLLTEAEQHIAETRGGALAMRDQVVQSQTAQAQHAIAAVWEHQHAQMQPLLANVQSETELLQTHSATFTCHSQEALAAGDSVLTAMTKRTKLDVDQVVASLGHNTTTVRETMAELVGAFGKFSEDALHTLAQTSNRTKQLVTTDYERLPPTGVTPRKRSYDYVDSWPRTAESSEILDQYYARQGLERPLSFSAEDVLRLLQEKMHAKQLSPTVVGSKDDVAMDTDGFGSGMDPGMDFHETPVSSRCNSSLSAYSVRTDLAPSSAVSSSASATMTKRVASYTFSNGNAGAPQSGRRGDGGIVKSGFASEPCSDAEMNTSLSGPPSAHQRAIAHRVRDRLHKLTGQPGTNHLSTGSGGGSYSNQTGSISVAAAAKIPLPPSPLLNATNRLPPRHGRSISSQSHTAPMTARDSAFASPSTDLAQLRESKLPKRTRKLRS